jgi:hypothetical protein
MLDHLILGLSIGVGLYLAHRLWPLIAIALVAIVAWFLVAVIALWKAIVFAVGMAWDWIRD